jgi:hypothetical protein
MKTTLSILILLASLSGCTKCYECRVNTTTTGFGTSQSSMTRIEKCDMTKRDVKAFKRGMEGTTTVKQNGKDVTVKTTVSCY